MKSLCPAASIITILVLCLSPALGASAPSDEEIAALIQALGDEAGRDAAQDRLWEAGSKALPALREALLLNPNSKVRESAARILGRMRAKAAAGALARALEDRQSAVRVAAALALSEIADPGTLGVLAKTTRHPDERTRANAAFALGHIKVDLSLMVLAGLVRDDSGEVRSQAAAAMGQLADERAAPLLAWMVLNDDYAETRALAAGALGDVVAHGAGLVLARALEDEETVVQSYAVHALRRLTGKSFAFSAHEPDTPKKIARRKWLVHLEADRERYGTVEPSTGRALDQLAESCLSEEAGIPPLKGAADAASGDEEAGPRELYNLGAVQHRLGNHGEAMAYYLDALELDKRLAQAHSNMGIILLEEGMTEAAMKRFEQAYRLDRKDTIIQANLARGYSALGETKRALDAARKAWRRLDPTEAPRRLYVSGPALGAALDANDLAFAEEVAANLGEDIPAGLRSVHGAFLFACGQERSALKELESARETGDTEERGSLALGRLTLRKGRNAQAHALAIELLGGGPRRAAVRCARLVLEAGGTDDAKAVLDVLSETQREDIDVDRLRIALLTAEGRYQAAEALARKILRFHRDARTYALLGDALAGSGELEAALSEYREALSRNIYLENAVERIVRIELARDGHAEAIELLEQAISSFPRRNARLVALLAEAYSAAGMDREAGEAATVALGENVEAGPLYVLAAYSWEGVGESGLALEALRAYVRELPGSRSFAALARFLGTCEDPGLRNEKEARFFAELALTGVGDVRTLRDAATAFESVGELDLAIRAMEKALVIAPDDPGLAGVLAAYLEEQERKKRPQNPAR